MIANRLHVKSVDATDPSCFCASTLKWVPRTFDRSLLSFWFGLGRLSMLRGERDRGADPPNHRKRRTGTSAHTRHFLAAPGPCQTLLREGPQRSELIGSRCPNDTVVKGRYMLIYRLESKIQGHCLTVAFLVMSLDFYNRFGVTGFLLFRYYSRPQWTKTRVRFRLHELERGQGCNCSPPLLAMRLCRWRADR